MKRCWMNVYGPVLLSLVALSARCPAADEIDYVEQFALAADRTVALQQLIPGTEDYYYYHCLHFQNTQQYGRVEQLLQDWIERHQVTPRVREIQHRQALLTYSANPQKTLDYLQRVLELRFDHQRETLGASPDLPTVLPASLLDRERLTQLAFQAHQNLAGFEDTALDWLIDAQLTPELRRNLLQRIRRPDHDQLVSLILADLQHSGSGGFGSLPIHHQLLLNQLDECLRGRPELLKQTGFVNIYLSKLRPGDDEDWPRDAAARQAYLDRLWTLVQRLAPSHNSLKAHVLYHRLQLDLERGIFDKPRFLTYLKLPRTAPYYSSDYIKQQKLEPFAANLGEDFRSVTLLPPPGDDQPLVRSYLQHFFLTETTYEPYASYLNDAYLKQVFAEAKILNGYGEAEQWASWLSPEQFRELRERVEIQFPATSRRYFKEDEPIRLDLQVKNVPTLIVKVYEINTCNYYRQQGQAVATDINLDGLVANYEKTYSYRESPLRRVTRHFEFPEFTQPGVYVVDFIGNGISSRAVIQKGRLQYLVRSSTAGHVFTVLDEAGSKLSDATLWLAGHEYHGDEDGLITVPYSAKPGRQGVVLSRGAWSTLESFEHQAETYSLRTGFYVEREALVAGKQASVLVRPVLTIHGQPVTLSVLENVRLVITSTDLDGVQSQQEVRDFALFEDRESTYEFQVPFRLAQLQFSLFAQVQNLSRNRKDDLAASMSFALNEIDKTQQVDDLHLMQIDSGYVLELLGKTGEPRAQRPVQLKLKHRDFTALVEVSLRSDEQGQVRLGPLPDISTLTAEVPGNETRQWTLRGDRNQLPGELHSQEGTVVLVPYSGRAGQVVRDELALLEMRGDQYVADRFDALSVADGMIRLSGLPPGDYRLSLKWLGQDMRIKIAAGAVKHGYVLGEHRQLELPAKSQPLQISDLSLADQQLKIQLTGTSPQTRVHVFATRYSPALDAFQYLAVVPSDGMQEVQPGRPQSLYVSGRKLGDEYRYIIDRKYAAKYPGNMLERPSLLLNPWAVRTTETGTQQAASGEAFRRQASESRSGRGDAKAEPPSPPPRASSPSLDFLAHGAAVLLNQVPGPDGTLVIDRTTLGPHQQIWVVALDTLSTACRVITLAESQRQCSDLRLANGLDPQHHYTQQKSVSVVDRDETFTLADISSARLEVYDSLAKIHGLFATLSSNPTLVEFSFVLQWDQLTPEEKHSKYSKYACHELNLFLYQKDPEFFREAVSPYLRNKKDKTFLDHWLLGDDLSAFTDPWAYGQLNAAEQVLLARRLASERAATRRWIKDQYALLPHDPDRFNFLFETAVSRSALRADDTVGKKLAAAQDGVLGALFYQANRADVVENSSRAEVVEESEKDGVQVESELAAEDFAAAGIELQKTVEKTPANGTAFFGRDRSRGTTRQLYQQVDKTQEWAENNYYHLPIEQATAGLIRTNGFWRDVVNQDPDQPFLSPHVAEATGSFAEMMLALALLDLPLQSAEHQVTVTDRQLTLVARHPLLAFHEEIQPATESGHDTPILVSQNFFNLNDRYRYESDQKLDKYVTDEFLIHAVYGCQVVVTNPTSAQQKLNVLLQVPVGAIPVLGDKRTCTKNLDLQPYQTATLETHFYFPVPGDYTHFPVHVSRDTVLLAWAQPVTLHVVKELTKFDRQSWEYLSQRGSDQEVLSYLESANLHRIDLSKIAFRMRDKSFFQKVVALLTANHMYQPVLWSYGIQHNVPEATRNYLAHHDFAGQCGDVLRSPLLEIDPVARHTYQHLDYRPLINARTHQLGQRRQIVNDRLLQQYQALMKVLSYEHELNDDQLMAVTYYLLLQDRIAEALDFFGRVNPDRLPTRLQYDYFTAYLDFYNEDPQLAGQIAARYKDYPVDRWRQAFEAVASQLEEIHNGQAEVVDPQDRQQTQTQLAATEPALDFSVEARKVRVTYQNLQQVQINYYLMDVELLFSRNPFAQEFSGQFSTIRPNSTAAIDLPADQTVSEFELPEQYGSSNVLIEMTAAGLTRAHTYYANSLAVQLVENYGQLKVAHQETHQPLSKVYVKVYGRMQGGQVRFYKDGYTDLRGRFDYASLSTSELDNVERFAVLVLSEEHGAIVREVAPPKR